MAEAAVTLQEALEALRAQSRAVWASAAASGSAKTKPAPPPPSEPPPAETLAEKQLRHSLLSHFFSAYTQTGGDEAVEMRMMTYHSETADIHVHLLELALRRILRTRPGTFMPEIYEIRRAAACALRNLRAGRQAICASSQEPHGEVDVERYIGELAPQPGQPWSVPQLAAVAGR